MRGAHTVAGVGISTRELAVIVRPPEDGWIVANDDEGMSSLVVRLTRARPDRIVVGGRGGAAALLAWTLALANLPVVVVAPHHTVEHIRGAAARAPAAFREAAVCVHFGQVMLSPVAPVTEPEINEAAALLCRRRQLLDLRLIEQNNYSDSAPLLHRRIAQHLSWLEHELQSLDEMLCGMMRASAMWQSEPGLAAMRRAN